MRWKDKLCSCATNMRDDSSASLMLGLRKYASKAINGSRGGLKGVALGAEAPPSPRLPPFAEKFMSSLSPTFIISVHARFSKSDSFVDLPQEVVN